METASPALLKRSFSQPDETLVFEGDSGNVKIIRYDGQTVGVATYKKGWRWSTNVKPVAKTESCQALHTGYVISGQMTVRMDDGTEATFGPGDLMIIPPGHDGWVDGDDCVVVDWSGVGHLREVLTRPS